MSNNDFYYQKYLKYKTKYFDLVGGEYNFELFNNLKSSILNYGYWQFNLYYILKTKSKLEGLSKIYHLKVKIKKDPIKFLTYEEEIEYNKYTKLRDNDFDKLKKEIIAENEEIIKSKRKVFESMIDTIKKNFEINISNIKNDHETKTKTKTKTKLYFYKFENKEETDFDTKIKKEKEEFDTKIKKEETEFDNKMKKEKKEFDKKIIEYKQTYIDDNIKEYSKIIDKENIIFNNEKEEFDRILKYINYENFLDGSYYGKSNLIDYELKIINDRISNYNKYINKLYDEIYTINIINPSDEEKIIMTDIVNKLNIIKNHILDNKNFKYYYIRKILNNLLSILDSYIKKQNRLVKST